MSADCVRCVVACGDGCVYVYNLRSAELLFTFSSAERTGGVADMRLSADDRFIFSAAHVSNTSLSRRISYLAKIAVGGALFFDDDMIINKSAIVAKLLDVFSAWWGFTTATDRGIRSGLCGADVFPCHWQISRLTTLFFNAFYTIPTTFYTHGYPNLPDRAWFLYLSKADILARSHLQINPLDSKGNYSGTSNNTKLVRGD